MADGHNHANTPGADNLQNQRELPWGAACALDLHRHGDTDSQPPWLALRIALLIMSIAVGQDMFLGAWSPIVFEYLLADRALWFHGDGLISRAAILKEVGRARLHDA